MRYFTNIRTLEKLKKEYKSLAMKYHPDRGGDTEAMQEINSEYDALFKLIQDGRIAEGETFNMNEAPEEFRDALEKIIRLFGIEIEVCGSWIWVSGNTFPHKEILNSAGFVWRKKKKMWSFGDLSGNRHREWDIKQIRSRYGSEKIAGNRSYAFN